MWGLLTLEEEHIHVGDGVGGIAACCLLPAPSSQTPAFTTETQKSEASKVLRTDLGCLYGEVATLQREKTTCLSSAERMQLGLEGSGGFLCQRINMTFRDRRAYYWLWVFLAQCKARFVKSPAK